MFFFVVVVFLQTLNSTLISTSYVPGLQLIFDFGGCSNVLSFYHWYVEE